MYRSIVVVVVALSWIEAFFLSLEFRRRHPFCPFHAIVSASRTEMQIEIIIASRLRPPPVNLMPALMLLYSLLLRTGIPVFASLEKVRCVKTRAFLSSFFEAFVAQGFSPLVGVADGADLGDGHHRDQVKF